MQKDNGNQRVVAIIKGGEVNWANKANKPISQKALH